MVKCCVMGSNSDGRTHARMCKTRHDGSDCRYPIARLLERLVAEDYIRPERAPELMNRSHNLERGHGFITTKELEDKQSEKDLLS